MAAIATYVDDLKAALESWAPGDPPAATWLLPELKKLLGAAFAGAYRPRAIDSGWHLDFMHGAGDGAASYVDIFHRYVEALPRTETFLALGNPHFVAASQRNRALSLAELARDQGLRGSVSPRRLGDVEPFASLFQRLGIAGHDQVRVLICDGPRQLAWVGATREEPFTQTEVEALRRLTKPLEQRLRLEHQLANPKLLAQALDAVLEALPTPAFVVGPSGSIELANQTGLALWERDRQKLLDSIERSERVTSGAEEFSVNRLGGTEQGYRLAVRKEACRIATRLPLAARTWGLTTRQTRVLECVARGASNKEIAAELACSEVTIENHITELFRRSGTRSRVALVSKLLR